MEVGGVGETSVSLGKWVSDLANLSFAVNEKDVEVEVPSETGQADLATPTVRGSVISQLLEYLFP